MSKTRFNSKYFRDRIFSYCIPEGVDFSELQLIVTIPAYKEPDLMQALESILHTDLRPEQYLILILFNYPASADSSIIEETIVQHDNIQVDRVYTHIQALRDKSAGVGLARKILMDSAAKIFYDIDKPDGVILAYDADCRAEPMHMDQVLTHFDKEEGLEAASIYYEHDLAICDPELLTHIIEYELHLRVYINWKRYIGLPYAYQTIGSSMAARAGVYTLVGGMNKRKAGEDFYFLHKFTNRGGYGEIRSTTVYPSSRVSDRVPFGTGRAILEASEKTSQIDSYNPESYIYFKKLIVDQLSSIYKKGLELDGLDPLIRSFIESTALLSIIDECRSNTSSLAHFIKRFYNRCDAFYFMKYLHYMRDHLHENVSSLESGNALLGQLGKSPVATSLECLMAFRELDKS